MPFDIALSSDMDLATSSGFANACFCAANLLPGTGHVSAPVCSTWVFMLLGEINKSIWAVSQKSWFNLYYLFVVWRRTIERGASSQPLLVYFFWLCVTSSGYARSWKSSQIPNAHTWQIYVPIYGMCGLRRFPSSTMGLWAAWKQIHSVGVENVQPVFLSVDVVSSWSSLRVFMIIPGYW